MWQRFWRLREAGVVEVFFDALASLSDTAHLIQMFDPTVVRAHASAAGAKGGSRGRRSAARGVVPPSSGHDAARTFVVASEELVFTPGLNLVAKWHPRVDRPPATMCCPSPGSSGPLCLSSTA